MSNNLGITRTSIMNLLADISPMARDYVDEAFEQAVVLAVQSGEEGEGVFLRVASDDLCIFYANFPDDSSPEILRKVSEEIDHSVVRGGELYFNVHGGNARIIQLVQSKGFVLEMEGYVLRYSPAKGMPVALGELVTEAPAKVEWESYVELFEAAYEQLNRENGWDTKGYSKTAETFLQGIKELEKRDRLKSFWKDGVLIGCYIVDGHYITDLVVHPRFQNKGYGSLMLKHCIHFLHEEMGIPDIYLRVTKSNSGAKRLYERSGFTTISYFAEHAYMAK